MSEVETSQVKAEEEQKNGADSVKQTESEQTKPMESTESSEKDSGDASKLSTSAEVPNESGVKPAESEGGDSCPPSEQEKKIIKQIEYYFGDLNLARDKFLQLEVRKDEGWVALSVLTTFNRLKQLSDDVAVISAALRKSTSGLVEVSEDNTKIRRNSTKPLPSNTKEMRVSQSQRSVYMKGFPLETTLDQIMEFVEPLAKYENIFMRKDQERKFKGSVWVLFETVEGAKKVMEMDEVKFKDNPLEKLFKEDYWARKNGDKRKARRGEKDADKKHREENRREEETKMVENKLTKGALIKVDGLPDEIQREDIKVFFASSEYSVAWVDWNTGDKQATVRFNDEGSAFKAVNNLTKGGEKVIFKEAELTIRVITGEEEMEHWRSVFQEVDARRRQQKRKRMELRHKKGGGRKGGRGGKKRRTDTGDDDGGNDSGDASGDE